MWYLIDTTGFIQIGWEYDPEVYREKKTDEMTMDEFLEKYGEPVMTDNDKDADAFCRQMEELKSTITNEALRKDFELVSGSKNKIVISLLQQFCKFSGSHKTVAFVYKNNAVRCFFYLPFPILIIYCPACTVTGKKHSAVSTISSIIPDQINQNRLSGSAVTCKNSPDSRSGGICPKTGLLIHSPLKTSELSISFTIFFARSYSNLSGS